MKYPYTGGLELWERHTFLHKFLPHIVYSVFGGAGGHELSVKSKVQPSGLYDSDLIYTTERDIK